LARIAAQYAGIQVLRIRAQELSEIDRFDGIYALASLIHVPSSEEITAWNNIIRALKPGGVFFASYRHGDGAAADEQGRLYRRQTESGIRQLVASLDIKVEIDHLTTVHAVGSDGQRYSWLNILVSRPPNE